MAGTDTVRGITFQHAQALVDAYDVLTSPETRFLRVEGAHDVVDIEVLDAEHRIVRARQAKVRQLEYTWGQAEIVTILRRWAAIDNGEPSQFELVTDGRLGPSGEAVRQALESAKRGTFASVASIFETAESDPICKQAARMAVTSLALSGEALFADIESRFTTILPSPATLEEANNAAADATNKLYRKLSEVAGLDDPTARIVSQGQLADFAGLDINEIPTTRWDVEQQSRYISSAASRQIEDMVVNLDLAWLESAPLTLERADRVLPAPAGQSNNSIGVQEFLEIRDSVIVGRTGSGKSTTLERLRGDAARAGVLVVVARAELYVDRNLPLLVANGISEVINSPVTKSVGRDVLRDSSAVVLLDGISELPRTSREALADEIRVLRADRSRQYCKLCAVGRDLVQLKGVFPPGLDPQPFTISPLSDVDQTVLAQRVLSTANLPSTVEATKQFRYRVGQVLGDGARNPLLYRMALSLLIDGYQFDSRSDLYLKFFEALSARSSYDSLDILLPVLGGAFNSLLDDGRRYCDSFSWRTMLREVIDSLRDIVGADVTAASADADARRIGVLRTFGSSRTVAAIHDSVADYLSAVALSRGVGVLPEQISTSDEQRLIFLTEMGELGLPEMKKLVAELPFTAARVGFFDRRGPGETDLNEVIELLSLFRPADGLVKLDDFFVDGAGRVFHLRNADSDGTVYSRDDGRSLLFQHGGEEVSGGPLAMAARVWAAELDRGLALRGKESYSQSIDATESATLVADHRVQFVRLVQSIADDIFGTSACVAVLSDVDLSPREYLMRGDMNYAGIVPVRQILQRSSSVTTARVADSTEFDSLAHDPQAGWLGGASVETVLQTSPESSAVKALQEAIDELTYDGWLKGRPRGMI